MTQTQINIIWSDQKGSALVICMMILVVLTTLGLLSMQTATTETKIAVNGQRWEQNFNLAEGGGVAEAGHVGYARGGAWDWYQISDPDAWNEPLIPPNNTAFDPGDDSEQANPRDVFLGLSDEEKKALNTFWPRQNIQLDTNDSKLDYAYLVTYLGASDKMIKGYDAGSVSAYQFRINGAKKIIVEFGGLKIGVKSTM